MVSIRRLHDKNKSGLLLLIPLALITVSIAIIIMGDINSEYKDEVFLSIVGASSIGAFGFYIYLFVLFVTKGTIGNNRFGPDPLAWYRQNQDFNPNFTSNMNQGFDPRYNPNYYPNGQQNYNPNNTDTPPQSYDPNMPPQVYKNNTNQQINPRSSQHQSNPHNPQQQWNDDNHDDAKFNN